MATVFLPIHAADAERGLGQTSSASLEISISIAPRYNLISDPSFPAGKFHQAQESWLCLGTNSPAPLLSVLLVQAPPHEPSLSMTRDQVESVTELKLCGLAGNRFASPYIRPNQLPGNLLVLVRPQ